MRSILYGAFAAALLSPLAVQAAPSAKGQPMRQVDWKNHSLQHHYPQSACPRRKIQRLSTMTSSSKRPSKTFFMSYFMPTGLAYSPEFLKHRTSSTHPESPQRLQAIYDRLAAEAIGIAPTVQTLVVVADDRQFLL